MAKHKIEIIEKCKACKGTGLYVGIAERDGAAVVCRNCSGTGRFHFIHEYEDFEGLQKRDDVKRVIQSNPGIVVGEDEERGLKLSDFGGMPYEDWLAGKPFPPKSEMRKHTCPHWWYQVVDYNKKPNWDECLDGLGYPFSKCPHFKTKEKCWEKFDKENNQQ